MFLVAVENCPTVSLDHVKLERKDASASFRPSLVRPFLQPARDPLQQCTKTRTATSTCHVPATSTHISTPRPRNITSLCHLRAPHLRSHVLCVSQLKLALQATHCDKLRLSKDGCSDELEDKSQRSRRGLHRTTRCASSAARSATAGASSGIFAAMVRRRKVTAARGWRSSRATRSGRRRGQGTRPTRRRRRRSRTRDRGRIGSERMPKQHAKDTHDDGAPWVEALCWVKAVADGVPGRPLVFGGLVADGPPKFGGKADHAPTTPPTRRPRKQRPSLRFAITCSFLPRSQSSTWLPVPTYLPVLAAAEAQSSSSWRRSAPWSPH